MWQYACSLCWVAAPVLAFLFARWVLSQFTVSVHGRNILITGCDTGFGRMAAEQLATSGANVYAACLTPAAAEEISQHHTGNIRGFVMDVTKEESVEEARKLVESEIPMTSGLHTIINNAGVLRGGNIDTMPISQWRLQLEVNVVGIAITSKAFLNLLRRAPGSRIVNVASVAGRLGTPGTAAYNASKFAVEGMSDAMRRELAMWGVKVVIIEPGIMKTPLWDVPMRDSELDKIWSTLSPEIQTLYGKEYFAKSHNSAKELVELVGGDPQQVVDIMQHTCEARWPRHRYAVGSDTPLWLGLALMPSWLADPILGFIVKQPLPQALR